MCALCEESAFNRDRSCAQLLKCQRDRELAHASTGHPVASLKGSMRRDFPAQFARVEEILWEEGDAILIATPTTHPTRVPVGPGGGWGNTLHAEPHPLQSTSISRMPTNLLCRRLHHRLSRLDSTRRYRPGAVQGAWEKRSAITSSEA